MHEASGGLADRRGHRSAVWGVPRWWGWFGLDGRPGGPGPAAPSSSRNTAAAGGWAGAGGASVVRLYTLSAALPAASREPPLILSPFFPQY